MVLGPENKITKTVRQKSSGLMQLMISRGSDGGEDENNHHVLTDA